MHSTGVSFATAAAMLFGGSRVGYAAEKERRGNMPHQEMQGTREQQQANHRADQGRLAERERNGSDAEVEKWSNELLRRRALPHLMLR